MRHIAMWSGPRNISTAMMRAWENRPDTCVVDEPFYAYFLSASGRHHPGRDLVLESQPNGWQDVVRDLLQDRPGFSVCYHKQMTHHIDDAVSLDWLSGVTNLFLVREPRAMLASLLRVLPDASLDDTGLLQQLRLFRHVAELQKDPPPVIDAADVLRDPSTMLPAICRVAGVEFDDHMLHWPAGPRDSDGVWAPWWYGSVEKSTGFGPYRRATVELPDRVGGILEQAQAIYDELGNYRITGEGLT